MSVQIQLRQNTSNPTLEEIADNIMEEISFKTFRDTGENFFYNNGIYIPGGEIKIKEECQKRITNCKIKDRKEIIETIRIKSYTDRENFDNNQNFINVKNGLINLGTGELEDHRPDVLSLIQFDVEYNPEAKSPKIIEFINAILPDPKDRVSVYEMLASGLLFDIDLQMAYFLIGKGSNGKSTFLNILEKLVGKNNISTVSLRDMTDDKYATSELYGKVVNIHADIANTEIKSFKDFKLIVTKETIRAQKKFGQPFTFKPFCKIFYSANVPPEIHDKSDATYRRLFPVEFSTQFKIDPSSEDLKNGVLHSNPKFVESLFTKDEISGLFNVLLKIAIRLRNRNKFTFSPKIEEVRQYWDNKADPVNDFVDEFLIPDPGAWISTAEMYSKYSKFCTERNLSVVGGNKFSQKLQQSKAPVVSCKKRSIHCWLGVWWRGVAKPDDMTDLRKRKTLNQTLE